MKQIHYDRNAPVITPAMAEEVKEAIKGTAGMLPSLIGLSAEERKGLPRIDVSNKVYADDAYMAAANHASLMPRWLSLEEMKRDIDDFEALDGIIVLVEEFYRKLLDTRTFKGAMVYSAALAVYHAFEEAGEAGIENAADVHKRLSARFKGQGRIKDPNKVDKRKHR